MNYLVQRGKVRQQALNVPEGLPEILSDIAREVLRCQPTTECLCHFIIDYLHSVIETREKARVAKCIIDKAMAVVDEVIKDLCVCDISQEKAEQMSVHMEECFRRFLNKMRCEEHKEMEVVRFEEEDMLDDMIKRCRFTEEELKISRPLIEQAYNRFIDAYMKANEDIEGKESLYYYFKERERKRVEAEKENLAATRIQANFRGYMVRRILGSTRTSVDAAMKHMEEEYQQELLEQENAALIIQKHYRLYRKRRSTKMLEEEEKGEVCEPGSETQIADEQGEQGKPSVVSFKGEDEIAEIPEGSPDAVQESESVAAEAPAIEQDQGETVQAEESPSEPPPAADIEQEQPATEEPVTEEPVPEEQPKEEPAPTEEAPAEEPPVEEPQTEPTEASAPETEAPAE